jgi:hypothetical protein
VLKGGCLMGSVLDVVFSTVGVCSDYSTRALDRAMTTMADSFEYVPAIMSFLSCSCRFAEMSCMLCRSLTDYHTSCQSLSRMIVTRRMP